MNNSRGFVFNDVVVDQAEATTGMPITEAVNAPLSATHQAVHSISLATADVSPHSSLSTDVEATHLSSSSNTVTASTLTKVIRHRLTRAEETAVLEAYSTGIPPLEIMLTFLISKTQLARILSDGFQGNKIQPVSPRYHLLQNKPQYLALFEFLGCSSAPFLKCEKIGDALNITAYGKDGV